MAKYILVPATGTEADAPVFATALGVARLLPAHLEFLHVRIDAEQTLTHMASGDIRGLSGIPSGGAGGGIRFGQVFQDLEQAVSARQRKAEAAFRDFCEREGVAVTADPSAALPSAEWRMETGNELTCLTEHARAADLIVLGREREGEQVAMDVLEVTLLTTGRPLLIAPQEFRTERSGVVAIGWSDRREAARAVAAAQPFLHLADRVVILAVSEDPRIHARSCERLRHALSWHNPRLTVQYLKPGDQTPEDTLLAGASALNADMLVMGGYGHSRVRETIFGGFTRRMLSYADLPVLMAH
jgi:nucleotide-binding universal stress UspA family protein